MRLRKLLEKKRMSVYQAAKVSGIPYTTLNEIVNGKTSLERCSAETVYKLAKAIDLSMEELLAPYLEKRPSFDIFRSNICHQVKIKGDIDFLIEELEKNRIRRYYDSGWYPESLYLLAMVDYLSRENGISLSNEYDDLRRCCLEEPVYPSSLLVASHLQGEEVLEKARDNAIPEFKRFNIIENEVRDVV